jgi:hypothetical protein
VTAESDASTPQGDGAAEQQTPRGAQGSTVAPPVLSTPDQAPSPPRPPSPLRNRTNWVTYVTLPLVGALALWIIQGGWGWVWDQVTGPPGVTVYTPGVSSFSSYTDLPVDAVKKNYESAAKEGVPVATKDNYPPELPLTLQTKTSQAIVVTGVKIRVLSRRSLPNSGLVIDAQLNGGPQVPTHIFDVDFTRSVQTLASQNGKDRDLPYEVEDRDFPYKVSGSDPAQVVLLLHPGQRDVRFTVEVEWVSDGEHGSETLDNHGQGYRVMGQGDLPRYYQELE